MEVLHKDVLNGHRHDISAYSREFISSAGLVKSTCTLYVAQLEYQTVGIQVDYTYKEKYQTLTS